VQRNGHILASLPRQVNFEPVEPFARRASRSMAIAWFEEVQAAVGKARSLLLFLPLPIFNQLRIGTVIIVVTSAMITNIVNSSGEKT
jgi:hypothetical protein